MPAGHRHHHHKDPDEKQHAADERQPITVLRSRYDEEHDADHPESVSPQLPSTSRLLNHPLNVPPTKTAPLPSNPIRSPLLAQPGPPTIGQSQVADTAVLLGTNGRFASNPRGVLDPGFWAMPSAQVHAPVDRPQPRATTLVIAPRTSTRRRHDPSAVKRSTSATPSLPIVSERCTRAAGASDKRPVVSLSFHASADGGLGPSKRRGTVR